MAPLRISHFAATSWLSHGLAPLRAGRSVIEYLRDTRLALQVAT
jgi:hypothetical protein